MDGVKYLLKFGEKQHLDSFANGNLYFSNAETFPEYRKQATKIKGKVIPLKQVQEYLREM